MRCFVFCCGKMANSVEWQPTGRRSECHVVVTNKREGPIDFSAAQPLSAFPDRRARSRTNQKGGSVETCAEACLPTTSNPGPRSASQNLHPRFIFLDCLSRFRVVGGVAANKQRQDLRYESNKRRVAIRWRITQARLASKGEKHVDVESAPLVISAPDAIASTRAPQVEKRVLGVIARLPRAVTRFGRSELSPVSSLCPSRCLAVSRPRGMEAED